MPYFTNVYNTPAAITRWLPDDAPLPRRDVAVNSTFTCQYLPVPVSFTDARMMTLPAHSIV